MDKKDFVYIVLDRFKELREQFYRLWCDEPIKLNAFIYEGKLAFYDLTMTILTPQFYTFVIDFHYNKNKKTLVISDKHNGYEGQVSDLHIIVDNFSSPEHQRKLFSNTIVLYEDNRAKERLWGAMREQNKTPADWVLDLAIVYYTFNLVAMSLPQKLKEKVEKDTKPIEVKTKQGKRYKPVVYMKHTYILDNDFKLSKGDIKHIIKCPAWGVRGHPRHLKSGRVIYIKPYKKGKQRNDPNVYVGKEYKF